jgi:hypothetical protein
MKIQILLIFYLGLAVQLFAEVTTYFCTYSHVSDQDGVNDAEDPFVLTFLMNEESGECYMLGKLGATQVIPVVKENQITFIEITETGNVMTTTIDSKLGTVHSRNTVILGEMSPSQYYGTCIIK